ncbi:hypothetical protein HMN09_00422400 [Mycena chlorophos]|uniref:Uncharacterized protein n=1 Tax=Mycena chlorophos TaxID=658473 RepID=A0A8H6TJJ6_MYCCL|nr:hypothetical protein HMN09_00422400 [Mycena chlorophos]
MSVSTLSSVDTASLTGVDSGASLSRRPRTRTRSKTLTGSPNPSPSADNTSFPPAPLVAEPAEMYPAAFSRPREFTAVRDSMITLGSGASSSIYPPSTSTSTASGTESPPSPRSLAEQLDSEPVSSFDPELEHEYDGDDVSYRLKLLVKNSYFLPPAHTKPSPSDLAASDSSKRPTKPPPTPTFFENIFRRARSKSRSKPSTPTGGSPPEDQPRGRTLTQVAQPPPTPSGRVMVVRERMSDIATAAKQAEQEMKQRLVVATSPSQSSVDVIDPTDAVDLPPPSAAYPFAVQASALHDMGVQDSVGAALLADRLPPHSPGAASVEGNWRKDLLHAAVDYSLSNDALVSPKDKSRSALSSPTSTDSGQLLPPRPARSPRRPLSPGVKIGQHIVPSSPISVEHTPTSSPYMRASPVEENKEPSRASSGVPIRVETPSMPFTPLAPPPRKIVNPLYSVSQTSLPLEVEPPLANAHGVSRLSETYDRHAMLSPPLIMRDRTSTDSDTTSFYSDNGDGAAPRPSIASSSQERISISLSTQQSPTRSAFHDALHDPPAASRPPRTSSLRGSLDFPSAASPVPRDSMASPPPRVSSSIAHFTPLLPPPRANAPQRPARSTLQPLQVEQPVETLEILAPPPITPPLPTLAVASTEMDSLLPPIPERRGPSTLSLAIPRQFVEAGPRSAPPGVASFFDSIQSQPNAMDDLDSSSDEDSDDEPDEISPPRTPIYVNSQTRALSNVPPPSSAGSSRSLLMRLGNHSTPYVSRSSDDDRRPVGNIPKSKAFFTQRRGGRSDQGHGPSSFDFIRDAQQDRPSTAGDPPRKPLQIPGRVNNPREQESLRRLDGMLLQHMEAERASLRRITTNFSNVKTAGKRLQ